MDIPFNMPPLVGNELNYVADALHRRHLSGDGYYTGRCQNVLSDCVGGGMVRLTHSCTASLEMAAILCNIGPGDEIIMPSFSFVSTANAFVLRGGVPVFVDIRPDTLNLDEMLIEAAITSRTKAIVVVHYAGVCCAMDAIQAIATKYGLLVVEDAAQALLSSYKGHPAGSLSSLACFSFHETKNVVSGEGGAIVVNDESLEERSDIIREKGTNRVSFKKRLVDKYTWVDIGSSYLPGEVIAACLLAQLEQAASITSRRLQMWQRYHEAFASFESAERLRRPIIPSECVSNGHIYYVLLRSQPDRDAFIKHLGEHRILAPFHYVPLHSAPAGRRYARSVGELSITNDLSARIVRLPLFVDLGIGQERVIESAAEWLSVN